MRPAPLTFLLVAAATSGVISTRPHENPDRRLIDCGTSSCDVLTDVCVFLSDTKEHRCLGGKASTISPSKTTGRSEMPSIEPSFIPSSVPSSIPSSFPSTFPSSDDTEISSNAGVSSDSRNCTVDIKTQCTIDEDDSDCASFAAPATKCTEPPFALLLRYHGGPCHGGKEHKSSNYSQSLIQCQDYNGGPPSTLGWKVYVTSTSDKGTIIFSDFVAVGSDFAIDSEFDSTTTIKIYTSSATVQENLLQSISFTSDCSSALFLKDSIGPAQLLLFANNAQGVVSSFIGAKYLYTIENMGTDTGATLTGLHSFSSLGTFNLSSIANDLKLEPGENVLFEQEILLDVSTQQRYTSLSTITARSPDGYACSDQGFLSVIINGTSIGREFGPPQSTGSTNVSNREKCALKVETKCVAADKAMASCEDIKPMIDRCQYRPHVLMFRYHGGGCSKTAIHDDDANRTSMIECVDDILEGPPVVEGELSYIVASDLNDVTQIYHASSVPVGGEFLVQFGTQGAPKAMLIRIFSSAEAVPTGEFLQSIALLSDCSTSDKIMHLQDQFGSVQLIVIANEDQGVMTNLMAATFSFFVTNLGPSSNVILTQMNSVTTLGVLHAAEFAIGDTIQSNATAEFRHDFLIDAAVRHRYTSLTMATADTFEGYTCEGKDLMTFVVAGFSQTGDSPGNVTSPSSDSSTTGPPGVSAGSLGPSPSGVAERYPSIQPSPSIDRSNAPSPASSPATETPSVSPPSDAFSRQDCHVELDVKCIAVDGQGDCSTILPQAPKCEDRPTGMLFRYHGGPCSLPSSATSQSFVQCVDYNGGPTATVGDIIYIKIGDVDDMEVVYYEAEIAVGDSFTLDAPSGGIGTETLILVYSSSSDTSRSNLLQSIVFLSDCHVELSLEDKLGSIQLIGYENAVQGKISSLVNAIYEFTIYNVGSDGNVMLSSLNSITSLGAIEFPVSDTVLAPASSISFQREVTIDATKQRRYTALSTVTGKSVDGSKCSQKQLFSFAVRGSEDAGG